MDSSIRRATADDRRQILAVYHTAFAAGEREKVGSLAVDLLNLPDVISLVAEENGDLVGHVAFSPVLLEGIPNSRCFILAPLAVSASLHGKGIGSDLVREGIKSLERGGATAILVYGDPDYYGRFGFKAESAANFIAPYPLEYDFGWQAVSLQGAEPLDHAVAIKCVEPLQNPALW